MKKGEINNCKKCLSSYSQYDNNPQSDWSEYWCELSVYVDGKLKKPKGLCQFCNPKTKLYNN